MWRERWEIQDNKNIGGGQGNCYIVYSKENRSQKYFLKELKEEKENNNSERRWRFFKYIQYY